MIVTAGWNLEVDDPSRIHGAETAARLAGLTAGLAARDVAACELAAVELATNLTRYADAGRLLINAFGPEPGMVQLVAVDKGPGIGDVGASMVDGYSTTGDSLGAGLGACRRIAAVFDLYSLPGQGTAVLVQIGRADAAEPAEPAVRVGGVVTPHPAETAIGDGWGAVRSGDLLTLAVVDGLGHGVKAADARHVALETVRRRPDAEPQGMLDELDAALRGTRGAAGAVAQLDTRSGGMRFGGVGNLTARLHRGPRVDVLVSRPGILGMGKRPRPYERGPVSWDDPGMLVMSTDGVGGWDLGRYPGVERRHPAIAAALIWRDAWRGTDDATVVVASRSPARGTA
ncbi:SpoIIE family protein phosphatase [Actinomadura sp. NPDC047616]|uniref:SpoIIE family protein phosphatase n=1 Tax=Actinomadura sp. NPDC047616 TaxID=3155914 RepID=UPI0033FCC53A